MRTAPGWQGALRTSVSCLPVNAALAALLHADTLRVTLSMSTAGYVLVHFPSQK